MFPISVGERGPELLSIPRRVATLEEGRQDIKQAVSIDDVNKIVAAAIADHSLKIKREFGAMMSNHKKNFA